jgi:transposase
VRGELLAESRKHPAVKILRQIPLIGPLRATLLVALMQTPYRFRSKRQLWTYSGLGVETHDSAQHRYVDGQLQRSKKPQQIRGLNQNHNHACDLFPPAFQPYPGCGPAMRRGRCLTSGRSRRGVNLRSERTQEVSHLDPPKVFRGTFGGSVVEIVFD